jgi:hypothetical protein
MPAMNSTSLIFLSLSIPFLTSTHARPGEATAPRLHPPWTHSTPPSLLLSHEHHLGNPHRS